MRNSLSGWVKEWCSEVLKSIPFALERQRGLISLNLARVRIIQDAWAGSSWKARGERQSDSARQDSTTAETLLDARRGYWQALRSLETWV